ncbi:MAG: hypothetical protein IKU48_04360 [Clostridia bacterium]|nr:hypothetical protein [Clostridia bacterium]
MKKFFKRVPALIIVSLIIILTVAFAVVAANSTAIGTWLGYVVNDQTGEIPAGLQDINNNGKIDILDVIFAVNNSSDTVADTYTIGIY